MDESVKKRVDESWKEQAEREKQHVGESSAASGSSSVAQGQGVAQGPDAPQASHAGADEIPQARFDLFVSRLAVEALIALGDMPHPVTRKTSVNVRQAKYLIDLLGILDEKTKGNVSVDEERLLKDALYQLRMRYLTKSGGPVS